MKYRKLGTSDLNVSVVGLGTWALGSDFFGSVDDADGIATIQAALDAGVNLIDTAPAYGSGHSEEVVGKAIAGRRDRAIVATKIGVYRRGPEYVRDLSVKSLRSQLEDSLRRLKVETIDLYQIHWPDPKTPLGDALPELERMQKEGKYRHLGVSNFSVKQMEEARSYMEIVSLQPHYSILERTIDAEVLPYCRRSNIGVLGYGTLAAGILTGKFREIPRLSSGDTRDSFYHFFKEPVWGRTQSFLDVLREMSSETGVPVSRLTIAWTVQRPGMTCALVGAKRPDQARENAAAGSVELSEAHIAAIDAAYDRFLANC